VRFWDFENVTSQLRDRRRPSPEVEQERTYVQRKTPRGILPEFGPVSSNYYYPKMDGNNSSRSDAEFTLGDLWTMVTTLQQELKKTKNEKMAVKWENDELKVENRRVKMYNDELNKNQVQLAKENDRLKKILKHKECLLAGRTPIIENRLKNNKIANLID